MAPATTTTNDKNADRSNAEIKALIRKLHPDAGNHKDRLRRLAKFRSYVLDTKGGRAPEFYDDDIPLLLLGASAPSAYLDEDEDYTGLYGLLSACGTPSDDAVLKRSAKQVMQLVKWLLLDWQEPGVKTSKKLNVFAQSFLSLPVSCYAHMNLDLHLSEANKKDDRGGSKDDACHVLVLILSQHLTEDGEGPSPVSADELLSPKAQQELELWMSRNISQSLQDKIAKNIKMREGELLMLKKQHGGGVNSGRNKKPLATVDVDEVAPPERRQSMGADAGAGPVDLDNSEHPDDTGTGHDDDTVDGDDIMAALRKRKKSLMKDLKQAERRGEYINAPASGTAARWEDSQTAREQAARAAALAKKNYHANHNAASSSTMIGHDTVRDSQQAAMEAVEREEEKHKTQSKDPLGLIQDDTFDLRHVEQTQAEGMEQALHELQEELQKAETSGNEKLMKKVSLQKESLEALVDRLGGIDALENVHTLQKSVLPTDGRFDPVLFLTLVHRVTSYDQLISSMDRLSNKAENQVEQLQNLVRDNFPLFVRCAEGFDDFRRKADSDQQRGGVNERVEKLEAIAESCTYQAKKSFKPLLDNTSEVRKVQSAMAVLQRVAPILQVPALMRQHVENRRYSEALKTYRRVQTVDESVHIELLMHVRAQAEDCVRDTRVDLEKRLAQDKISVNELVEGIRDLVELLELDVEFSQDKTTEGGGVGVGVFEIDGVLINVREHPPALACLLLQAAHFSSGVKKIVTNASETTSSIFAGEGQAGQGDESLVTYEAPPRPGKAGNNQWKYEVLDARVTSTVKAVHMIRMWLPRLVKIGKVAKEDEKHRAARSSGSRRGSFADRTKSTAFDVFVKNIKPSIARLVEHAIFCALGSSSRGGGKEVVMSFGQNVDDRLRELLRSPLPPSQSGKAAKELADLVEIVSQYSGETNALRPDQAGVMFQLSPLDDCKTVGDAAVVTIEKRRCIYAFDACARTCLSRASGSGKFDADSLVACLRSLSDQLTRPGECATEVESGCDSVVRRCCDGLGSYVRDRGDAARLSAVAECADVMGDKINDIVREVAALTPNAGRVQEAMIEQVLALEGELFDDYLNSIRQSVASNVCSGWLDGEMISGQSDDGGRTSFPAYLSSSLLAIVRCRAQVEQALGDKIRRTDGVQYQHLTMSTVSDGVVEGICSEIVKRKMKLKVRQADRLANEIEFLKNTLKRFLSDRNRAMLDSTLQVVSSKAGRGRDYQGDGPDGLAALEELERLGRVYVMCLGD